jgi:hypothetical protein
LANLRRNSHCKLQRLPGNSTKFRKKASNSALSKSRAEVARGLRSRLRPGDRPVI